MWAFLKATLIPGLIVRIGVKFLYHTLFKPVPIRRVRRTNCYHTRRRIDRYRHRANIHQENDGMYRGRPLNENKPNKFHRENKTESMLEKELRRNRRCPPKPPRPRPSKRRDGYGSECHEKDGLMTIPLNLRLFQDFSNSLPLKCNEK
jgi:hypothetical protein